MSVIHKVNLKQKEVQKIALPESATMLSVQVQFCMICLWYMFDQIPNQPTKERTVYMSCTGQEFVCDGFDYVGTVLLNSGNFVLHVFVD